jgi:hypothetical protein
MRLALNVETALAAGESARGTDAGYAGLRVGMAARFGTPTIFKDRDDMLEDLCRTSLI